MCLITVFGDHFKIMSLEPDDFTKKQKNKFKNCIEISETSLYKLIPITLMDVRPTVVELNPVRMNKKSGPTLFGQSEFCQNTFIYMV